MSALASGATAQHAGPTWPLAQQSDQQLHPAIGSEAGHQRRALLAFARDQRFALAVSLGNDDLAVDAPALEVAAYIPCPRCRQAVVVRVAADAVGVAGYLDAFHTAALPLAEGVVERAAPLRGQRHAAAPAQTCGREEGLVFYHRRRRDREAVGRGRELKGRVELGG